MSVIRSLSASENYQQREIEKAKLEHAYKESDEIVDKLIAEYAEDFSKIIQSFSKISTNMTESNISIKKVKENLTSCKKLLNCQRDDLKVLWLDGLQQKYTLEMLEQIEIIKNVPNEIESKLIKKRYMSLAELYVTATSHLEGDLKQVEGLREIKAEIITKKEKIKYSLVRDLRNHLYIRTTVKGDYRPISDIDAYYKTSPLAPNANYLHEMNDYEVGLNKVKSSANFLEATKFNVRKHLESASKKLFAVSGQSSFEDEMSIDNMKINPVKEDLELIDPEFDSAYFMTISIQALAKLNSLNEAFELLKTSMQSDLCSIVLITAHEIKTRYSVNAQYNNPTNPTLMKEGVEGEEDRPELFKVLLETLFAKFWSISRAHKFVIKCFLANSAAPPVPSRNKDITNDKKLNTKKVHPPESAKSHASSKIPDSSNASSMLPPYDILDVWSFIQGVIQMTLIEYLAIESSSAGMDGSSYPTEMENLNNYFVKSHVKRNISAAKRSQPLFKFDNSVLALNAHKYAREQRKRKSLAFLATSSLEDSHLNFLPPLINYSTTTSDNKDLPSSPFAKGFNTVINFNTPVNVCKPSIKNLRTVYLSVQDFCKRLENEIKMQPPTRCLLYSFFNDYVREIYLVEVHNSASSKIESHIKGPEAWKALVTPDPKVCPDVDRPLLLNAFVVDRCVNELRDIIRDMPDYSNQFLLMNCKILQSYKDVCLNAYKNIVQPETEDKRIISATWAKDEDINRFLRSLPNWHLMRQHTEYHPNSPSINSPDKMASIYSHKETQNEAFSYSPTANHPNIHDHRVDSCHAKESEILASNLGDEMMSIPDQEILTDPQSIKTLALIHESLEWLACVKLGPGLLQDLIQENDGNLPHIIYDAPEEEGKDGRKSVMNEILSDGTLKVPVSNFIIDSIKTFVQDFEELSETCLLVIHLELRVHCFYFLKPLAKQYEPINQMSTQNAQNSAHSPPNESASSSSLQTSSLSDVDSSVLKLNKDLTSIEEVLSFTLLKHKLKYVVEGLGHLISTLVIGNSSGLPRIDHEIIKRMCHNVFALQQNLTNITLNRESDLDRAKTYYEMLYKSPDEIINSILEQGPIFSQLEYKNAFRLLHRSLNVPVNTQKNQFKRLEEVLKKPVAV
ncbi:exocyst complex component 4-like isoform X1 [Gordionus sp. m RMFG-2023]|uniref:exocyst complex component 4-like isoform X1 n=2 Tax=Gordionus sp. m RMFG-2023 TaxID=3053472 RepID=UPI0031FC50D8